MHPTIIKLAKGVFAANLPRNNILGSWSVSLLIPTQEEIRPKRQFDGLWERRNNIGDDRKSASQQEQRNDTGKRGVDFATMLCLMGFSVYKN